MGHTFFKEQNELAMDTIMQRPTRGIPTGLIHLMEHSHIERIACSKTGSYIKDPEAVYIKMLRNIGVDIVDQYLALNPMVMGNKGYDGAKHGATTGAERVILDDICIDSPEAVVEHLEKYDFPKIELDIAGFNEEKRVKEIIQNETSHSIKYGEDIIKTGYGFIKFPSLYFSVYGYANYFMAFALYPEIMEKHFKLQGDFALLNNKAAARAYKEAELPPLYRLDHDMADSRGMLVNIKILDKIWLPHFERCLQPVIKSGVKTIWHCDGNLSVMIPRLIDVGIKGFQGFQYEHGMDYKKICSMKTKDGDDLIIEAGVSVSKTLPFGTSEDVKKEMHFLVENGPKTGLFLSTSSSVTPGVPWENIETMIEGFKYYKKHGRA